MENTKEEILLVLKRLKSFNIDFIIVGGFAKYLHGLENEFKDVDIFIAKDFNYSENIIQFLQSFNPHYLKSSYEFEDVLRMRIGNFKFDFLPKLHGLENVKVYETIVPKNYGSEVIKVLSSQDLEINIQTIKKLIPTK